MYLGHHGMPCPRRTSAGHSGTQSGFASGGGENLTDIGGLEEDEDIVGEDASDNDDWEDHPSILDTFLSMCRFSIRRITIFGPRPLAVHLQEN